MSHSDSPTQAVGSHTPEEVRSSLQVITPAEQLFVGSSRPQREEFDSIENHSRATRFHKPKGGFWTSPLLEPQQSAWTEHLHGAGKKPRNDDDCIWRIEPTDDVAVLVIDSESDLDMLLTAFSRETGIDHTPIRAPIDFEQLATHYDGLKVTSNCISETTYRDKGLDGWDIESIVWFEWVFDDIERVGQLD